MWLTAIDATVSEGRGPGRQDSRSLRVSEMSRPFWGFLESANHVYKLSRYLLAFGASGFGEAPCRMFNYPSFVSLHLLICSLYVTYRVAKRGFRMLREAGLDSPA